MQWRIVVRFVFFRLRRNNNDSEHRKSAVTWNADFVTHFDFEHQIENQLSVVWNFSPLFFVKYSWILHCQLKLDEHKDRQLTIWNILYKKSEQHIDVYSRYLLIMFDVLPATLNASASNILLYKYGLNIRL